MTNTKTKTSPAKVIAAVVIAVILAFTLVCLLTGNINPVCRVTAILMPVWLAAELRLSSLRKVMEKRRHDIQLQQMRRDQKQTDERAALQYRHVGQQD